MSSTSYQRRVLLAMSLYVALLLLVYPLTRSADGIGLKLLCALTPLLPVLYVIWLMAQRVVRSDELEQRTHLIGLGVATAVASVFTLIGGFLGAAKLLPDEGAAVMLMWVFPILIITYSTTRSFFARRYGSDGCDDGDDRSYWRFFIATVVFSLVAADVYYARHEQYFTGLFIGVAVGTATAGALRYLHRRRRANADDA